MRLQLLIAGRVVATEEASGIEIEKNPTGGLTWDVRRDGTQSILTAKAQNGPAGGIRWAWFEQSVFAELTSGQWRQGGHDVPPHKSVLALADGRPAFVDDLYCAQLFSEQTSGMVLVCVPGMTAWDGKAFAQDLTEFRPIYQQWLTTARTGASKLAKDPKACPNDELRTAMALYLYQRVLGASEAEARLPADAIMRGLDPTLCRPAEAAATPPTPKWPEILGEMRTTALPKLERAAPIRPASQTIPKGGKSGQ